MSSFTSNFRSEVVVLFAGLSVAVACEIWLRVAGQSISSDMQHLQSLPGMARSIRSHGPATVMFLGNSLTQRGIDLDTITKVLGDRQAPAVRCFKVHPDGTTLLDWYYVLKHFFVKTHAAPDIVVVGFANRQLDDTSGFRADRIAAFAGIRYVRELFENDLRSADARVNYVLASGTASFADADRVRTVVFRRFIPGYVSSAQVFNATARDQSGRADVSRKPGSRQRLRRFLRLCADSHIMPVLIAMPVPRPYEVDGTIPDAAHAAGGAFLDLRNITGIDPGWYPDGFHMNAQAAAVYSRAVAEGLAEFLKSRNAGRIPPLAHIAAGAR